MENVAIYSILGILVGCAIFLFGIIIYLVEKSKYKTGIDYYQFFIAGILWTVLGAVLTNFILTGVGLLVTIFGLSFKKRWRSDYLDWKHLTKKERVRILILLITFSLVTIIGFISYNL